MLKCSQPSPIMPLHRICKAIHFLSPVLFIPSRYYAFFNSEYFYLLVTPPGREVEYCDQLVNLSVCVSVCLCVCLSVREHISGTAGPIFTKFCVQIPCGRGSVLLWQRCDMLCTSGFMDDVMFGRNGPYGVGDAWTAEPQPTTAIASLRYRGGV